MQKIFAGVLFTFGFVFLLITASVMLTKNPSEDDRDAALGGLMLGIPAMAGGTAIVLNMRRKKKELAATQSQQLETTFLNCSNILTDASPWRSLHLLVSFR